MSYSVASRLKAEGELFLWDSAEAELCYTLIHLGAGNADLLIVCLLVLIRHVHCFIKQQSAYPTQPAPKTLAFDTLCTLNTLN